MSSSNAAEILVGLKDAVRFDGESVILGDHKRFREKHLDSLVQHLISHPDADTRRFVNWLILSIAQFSGISPASIEPFYRAKGEGKYTRTAVPSFVVSSISYESARELMRAGQATNALAYIVEFSNAAASLGNSVTLMAAAALRESRPGPLFFQMSVVITEASQVETCKEQIQQAIRNGIYNFNIDASALSNSVAPTFETQQQPNYDAIGALLGYIRKIQPEGITASVGGTISGRTSVVDELRAVMDGLLQTYGEIKPGLAKMTLLGTPGDRKILEQLSEVAVKVYHLGGIAMNEVPSGFTTEQLVLANLLEFRSPPVQFEATLKLLGANNTVNPIGDTVETVKVKPLLPDTLKNLLVR